MLKKTLFAGLLAIVSTAPVLAHGGYDDYVDARVIRVEPHVSFSYSNWGGDDAFRILYEWGGNHYWTYGPRHPGGWVRVRPPHVIHHYYPAPHYRHDWRHDHRRDWRDGRHHDGRHDGHRGPGRGDHRW
jgi:hypothetical protein